MSNKSFNSVTRRRKTIDMLKDITAYFSDVRDALCAPYGLSSIQAVIVLDVYHNGGKTKITDICNRLNKETNTISPLVNRLIKKGFLTKVQSQTDQRVFYVELSEEAKKITQKISVDVDDFTWPIFESFTDEEFKKIYESLEMMRGVLHK